MERFMRAARFAVAMGAAFGAHDLGDYHVQTDHQAQHKGCDRQHGAVGHESCTTAGSRLTCLRHVATYTAGHAATLALASAVTGVRFDGRRVAAGLAVTAVTHFVIDRREPLRAWADLIGVGGFYRNGGAERLDQAAHKALLFASALIMTGHEVPR